MINSISIEQEIEITFEHERQWCEHYQSAGIAVDQDAAALARVRTIFEALTAVCHLPDLPWRVHATSSDEWGAFATFGGLVFVHNGLLCDVDDDELAAVLGHEIAHVTCRHITERLSHAKVSQMLSKKARTAYYAASYSTSNESESDRIGVLYAALAGFDPLAAHRVWTRIHGRHGSNPGNYTYTHPLNNQRAADARRFGEVAQRYYVAARRRNPQYAEILNDNVLITRTPDGDRTYDIAGALVGAHLEYRQAKKDARRRRGANQASKRLLQALDAVQLSNLRNQPTADGMQGVFVDMVNSGTMRVSTVHLAFQYVGGGKVLYEEATQTPAMEPGAHLTHGIYLRNVPGAEFVQVQIVNVAL